MNLKTLLEIVIARPLLTRKDLARRYGCHLDTIDDWHNRGTLPKAIYLPGCRIPLWRPVDIHTAETRNQRLTKRAKNSKA